MGTDWHLNYNKIKHMKKSRDVEKCTKENSCRGHIWITRTGGANYPNVEFIGSVLQDIIRDHLQFTDEVINQAKSSIYNAEKKLQLQNNGYIGDHQYVGVHVRRTDYKKFSKTFIPELHNGTFYMNAMDYYRSKHNSLAFLVVSDDPKWCDENLHGHDVFVIHGNSPAVDMAIMSLSDMIIIDYGTFSLWGAILSGGEVVLNNQTNLKVVAEYFGWTYL